MPLDGLEVTIEDFVSKRTGFFIVGTFSRVQDLTEATTVKEILGIEREALIFMLEVSRKSHPNEFAGILRAERGLIREVLVLPGTRSSCRSALLELHMLPIDRSACGTVHSHPSPNLRPSPEDLALFAKFGRVHVIIAYPYDESSWRAYDHRGREIPLKIVDERS